jgi:protein-export membrane protein SecD
MKKVNITFIIFIIFVVAAIWSLYPSYQLYTQKKNLSTEQETKLHKRALHLGLDLVGGMHLVLEVDKSKLTKEESKDATDRALEVIRNRIDQFGVFEPIIQKIGDRILIQLPGVDRERAKGLIGQTALLEFKMLEEVGKTNEVVKSIDSQIKSGKKDTTEESGLFQYLRQLRDEFAVEDADFPIVDSLLKQYAALVPAEDQLLFGKSEEDQGRTIRRLYLLKRETVLFGKALTDARHEQYQGNDPGAANTWVVNFTMRREDARTFARLTGDNVGKRLAIVLDNVVVSAPQIRERIPNGRGQITTGESNPDKAKDLAIVLRSGALPAPVVVAEERSVGASLGLDSIRKGIRAILLGSLLVVLFMLVYYSLSGLLADFALFFNIFFLVAVLAAFHATLTLPGLAGIALTIGMAVDANVLIFERIREELRNGKSPRVAIEIGYSKAFVTIIDANLTTIIAAIALYILGSGPIRGFAVTLTIGLVINVITAVYLTRMVFDFVLARVHVKKLRI